MSIYMSRLFQRSNSSFLLSSGNALQSQVVRLREDLFVLDSGVGTPRVCKRDELTRVPNRQATRFENKVGFLAPVASESLMNRQILERSFVDIVAGKSLIKDQATSKFNELVGSTDVVAGEPHIALPRRFRQTLTWIEINEIWRKDRKVKGFFLQKLRLGYAVGIAGHIAFLRWDPFVHQKLSKDRFKIERINPKKKDIVLF